MHNTDFGYYYSFHKKFYIGFDVLDDDVRPVLKGDTFDSGLRVTP